MVSSVTAANFAKALPNKVAPRSKVMDWSAMMIPTIDTFVPMVQLVPTCQKTLAVFAVPVKITLPELILRALPTWKIKAGFGSVPPSKVTFPFN